jgi:two-component system, chemotaxis family, chemotaxis protein CheY
MVMVNPVGAGKVADFQFAESPESSGLVMSRNAPASQVNFYGGTERDGEEPTATNLVGGQRGDKFCKSALVSRWNLSDKQLGGWCGAMPGISVLIVDDSSVMRKIVERALRQAGIDLVKVVEAANGNEGLTALTREQVDLIVSDVNMPNMDGLEFLRQIQRQSLAQGVPVVMITTESGEDHVREALTAGAQGYIRKPFTPEQVRDRVLPLLSSV